jgi:N-acetylglucosaminyl-diphospho-decaprenol L-rhamnosyltransferase
MKLSIIIVLYKSEDYIFNCLDSIADNSDMDFRDFEVILVDNFEGSAFQEALSVYQLNSPLLIKYVPNPSNGGFGAGNNIGVKNSSGEVLFFLNPDTKLLKNFSLQRIYKASTPNSVVGFKIVDGNGKENNSYGIFPEFSYLSFIFYFLKRAAFVVPNAIRFLNKMIWPWGAAFALRKTDFLQSGGFDEKIFLCNEEPDLLKRIPSRKIKLLNMPVLHFEGHTTKNSEVRFVNYLESSTYYFKKYNINSRSFFFYLTLREATRNAGAKTNLRLLREFKRKN